MTLCTIMSGVCTLKAIEIIHVQLPSGRTIGAYTCRECSEAVRSDHSISVEYLHQKNQPFILSIITKEQL